ncbi:MAG: PD40 domain-containing protein [Acidobacteria bacterium]|nr:PD40 domain-containing protein [Acidobacteriota bacterium]
MSKLLLGASMMALVALAAEKPTRAELQFEAAVNKEVVAGDLKGAITLYRKAAQLSDRAVAAKALVRMGQCYDKLGDAEARKAYERVVREFADQKEAVAEARAKLAALEHGATGAKSMVAQLIVKSNNLGLGDRITQDGRLVPYFDPETGDVAVRDLHTGAVRRLTNEGTNTRSAEARGYNTPIPSRDGKQIAYVWQPDSGQTELRVINVDGSGMRAVPYNRNGTVRIRDWSPDGKSILATGYGAVSGSFWWGMAAIELGSGEARVLRRFTRINPGGGYPDFDVAGYSPDGRWVVYSRQAVWDRPDWDIFALDTQTGNETAVVTGAGADRKPMWVPDGNRFVFLSDRSGKDAIWMVRFRDGQAAGAPILVKPGADGYDPKGISRDGSFFYAVSHVAHGVYQAAVDPQTLRVQGPPARLVETYVGHNWGPSWSPSGDSFAYHSLRDKISRLVIHHPNGKETVVADPIRWAAFPFLHWCGNGEGLLSFGTAQPWQVRIFDAQSGDALPPDVSVKGLRDPLQWGTSPDCKTVYVSSRTPYTADPSPRKRRIYRYDIATARETDLLIDAGEWATHPSVSPDGRWLALRGKLEGGKESGILVLSASGGPLRMLAPGDDLMFHSWTPDSKRLMYSRSDKPGEWWAVERELYWAPVEGGVPQSMGLHMQGAGAPSLNPDGKRLLFSAYQSTKELWVLHNLPLQ